MPVLSFLEQALSAQRENIYPINVFIHRLTCVKFFRQMLHIYKQHYID